MQGMEEILDLPVQEFVYYEKDLSGKKTRNEKKKQKVTRMKIDILDPQKRRQRNQVRRNQQKAKLQKQFQGLTQEEVRNILDAKQDKKKLVKQNILKAVQNGQMIFIDLVYESRMNQKQNKSLAIQIQLIMKSIRHLDNPPGIHLCSVGGKAQTQLQKMGMNYWPLGHHKEDISYVAKSLNKKLVYLSPDADQPLAQVNQDTAYVIGGLVDRTVIKNASYFRAKHLNIQSRYLPIKQMMKSRSCLNLDHVVMILSKFKQCGDWKIAFEFGAPKRWKKQQSNHQEQDEQVSQEQQQHSEQKQEQVQITSSHQLQKKQVHQQQKIQPK